MLPPTLPLRSCVATFGLPAECSIFVRDVAPGKHDDQLLDHCVTQHEISDAQIDRARIDGGFGFALAAFVIGLGLLAILDRIGLPDNLLRIGVLGLVFAGLIVIALWMRTMRPADFYAGSRRLPAGYAGLVFAGSAFALFLPFLPPLPQGISFASVALGLGLGCLGLLFVTGPRLRRTGGYSIADVVGARFPFLAVRVPVVLLIGFCAACVALGGYEIALRGLVATIGLDRPTGAAVLAGLLILLVVPAGLSGVIWISAAAAVVTAVALALPLGLGLVSGAPPVLPIFGETGLWSKAVADFAIVTGADRDMGFEIPVVIAFGFGVSTLSPLFGAAVASRDETTARRSGLVGAIWLVLGACLVAATLAGAALALEVGVSGHVPSSLPAALLAASRHGVIAICGLHTHDAAALAQACAGKANGPGLGLQNISSTAADLLMSLPLLRGSEPTLTRLAAVFTIILGMGVAASGVQSFVTSLAHDLVPARRRRGPVSRRLAVARAVAIAAVIGASFFLAGRSVDARFLFTFAMMLSAALVAPLLFLAFIPQSTTFSAFAALCVAGFVMGHFFVHNAAMMPLGPLAADAAFAAFDGLAVGLFVAFLPRKDTAEPAAASAAPSDSDQPSAG